MRSKLSLEHAIFQHQPLDDAELASRMPLRMALLGLSAQGEHTGLFAWRPLALKAAVLPRDEVDFAAVLSALVAHGFIERFEVGGERFGRMLPVWRRHPTRGAW